MLRRIFLQIAFATALLVPLLPLSAHAAGDSVPYSPEVVQTALADGRAVLLEFAAEW
ncbi:MAG: hypothetical protein HOK21_12455 [Rhodospirillaceae bacterium]|jgi:hypothetical protein|nr:hypothetical protein [Rhodospirillaceae bacterium]MBT4043417.1 hypothetical protein [Rhodospirillaceae bacterium]MBT4686887.1 hypothetical protein [Rhodospirillaceae bacterium]MBT5081867.1 hypothetical protein [Rhodospirillaceae bacterium]MBT5524895.1 hypothetical protein [Rhodospirillaceae bacterium]